MCLAIQGKVESVSNNEDILFSHAKVSFGGVTKDVNISMVPEVKVGDYVLVHVGVAISVVDEEEAKQTYEYLKQIGELSELDPE